jgi:hypothetical protein
MPRSAKNVSALRNLAAGEVAQNLGSTTAAVSGSAVEGCSFVDMLTLFYKKMRENIKSPIVNDTKVGLILFISA